jgi:hypothetical protein
MGRELMNAIGTWLRVDAPPLAVPGHPRAAGRFRGGGTIIAAVAGARRGDTALRRWTP